MFDFRDDRRQKEDYERSKQHKRLSQQNAMREELDRSISLKHIRQVYWLLSLEY
jgi:hypothetical protein